MSKIKITDELLIEELKKRMAEDLPAYMVPEIFIELRDFPKNPNGKIDRNALIKLAETEAGE